MVAYGYILPKKNLEARLKALDLAINNQNLKNINAKLNLSLYEPLTLTEQVPTIVQQTGQPIQMPQTKGPETPPTQPPIQPLTSTQSDTKLSVSNTVPLSESKPLSAKEKALKSSIESEESRLKRKLTEQERSDIEKLINKTTILLEDMSVSKTKNTYNDAKNIDNLKELLLSNNNNKKLSKAQLSKEVSKINTSKINELLLQEVKKGTQVYYPNRSNQKEINTEFVISVSPQNYLVKSNGDLIGPVTAKKSLEWLLTPSMTGGKINNYPFDNAPNFGNLFLREKTLKNNKLTLYRPYTRKVMLSKSNISPLLKKMILDIQNTLEFDEHDYHNLEGDEKRVIERIIRLQKDMKNYNIQALIDEDDMKTRKRLEILVGQINAGNNSSLIREEMKTLLKNLYDNKAISLNKYNASLKSIKALET